MAKPASSDASRHRYEPPVIRALSVLAFVCDLPSIFRLELWDVPCLLRSHRIGLLRVFSLSCHFTLLDRPAERAIGVFIFTCSYQCIFASFGLLQFRSVSFSLLPTCALHRRSHALNPLESGHFSNGPRESFYGTEMDARLECQPEQYYDRVGCLCRSRLLYRALSAPHHCDNTPETTSFLCSWADRKPYSTAVPADCLIVGSRSFSLCGLLRLCVLCRLRLADTTFGSAAGRDRDGLRLRR